MKMKNLSLAFVTLLSAAGFVALSFTLNPSAQRATAPSSNFGSAAEETYKVDATASSIDWKAYKVTGQHNGSVNVKSGSLTFADGKLTGGSFEMDMTTIKVLDLQGEWAGKLEGHLKSDDFFSTEKNPVSKFVITKVASRGTAGSYRVTGNLTVKGITKEIKFDATLNAADGKATGEAALKIDRTDFDIRYRSGNFFENLGDKTIYDEFDLNVKLVAAK